MLRLTYVAAFRSGAARARPLNYAACLSKRADTISIASRNPTLDLLFANHDFRRATELTCGRPYACDKGQNPV
jgi:hypothetical protein